jgi:DNA-binding transcriptional ArsR family regulator
MQILRALAHPARQSMMRAMSRKERCVGELARSLGLRQPAASQHLQVLRKANLVLVRSDANRRYYRANLDEIARLRAFLDGFWSDQLQALKVAAETRSPQRSRR